jgi:hypothetical protein
MLRRYKPAEVSRVGDRRRSTSQQEENARSSGQAMLREFVLQRALADIGATFQDGIKKMVLAFNYCGFMGRRTEVRPGILNQGRGPKGERSMWPDRRISKTTFRGRVHPKVDLGQRLGRTRIARLD